jgi:hypothetical protein
VQRAERWFLKRLSNFAQIESLWRFNAKYDPEWLPRYVVFDTAEHLVPVTMAIVRAESLWEIPVLGRILAAGAEKRTQAAQRETEEFLASVGQWDDDGLRLDPETGNSLGDSVADSLGDPLGESAPEPSPAGHPGPRV